MHEETRPMWGVMLGILIIVVVGSLFVYGQRQRIMQEQAAQDLAQDEVIPEPEEKTPLFIGGIVPLSGEQSEKGLAIQKSALIALKEINEEGGIDDRPVEIIWKDGECSGSAAATAAQELVTINEVDYLIGGVCNQEAIAVAPIASQHRSIFLSPAADSSELTKMGGQYFFRTTPSEALIGRATAGFVAKTLDAKKVTTKNTFCCFLAYHLTQVNVFSSILIVMGVILKPHENNIGG